jgi:hypothetical protein
MRNRKVSPNQTISAFGETFIFAGQNSGILHESYGLGVKRRVKSRLLKLCYMRRWLLTKALPDGQKVCASSSSCFMDRRIYR